MELVDQIFRFDVPVRPRSNPTGLRLYFSIPRGAPVEVYVDGGPAAASIQAGPDGTSAFQLIWEERIDVRGIGVRVRYVGERPIFLRHKWYASINELEGDPDFGPTRSEVLVRRVRGLIAQMVLGGFTEQRALELISSFGPWLESGARLGVPRSSEGGFPILSAEDPDSPAGDGSCTRSR